MAIPKIYNSSTGEWEPVSIGKTGNPGLIKSDTEPTDTNQLWLDSGDTAEPLVIPAGGDAGQILQKSTDGDYDTAWSNVPSHNYIINGGFDFWQRGTATANCAEGVYRADRWAPNGYQTNRVGRVEVASGSGPTSQYALRSNSRSTGSRCVVAQKIESGNAIPLRGKQITISFWLRHSAAAWTSSSGTEFGAFVVFLGWNTSTTDSSVITDTWDSHISFQIDSGSFPTTFTKYSYTTTVPATVNNITYRFGMNGFGTAADDEFWFEVTDVQLEEGSVATPFRRHAPSLQGELAACQRYYFRTGGLSVNQRHGFGSTWQSSRAQILVQTPVPMRKAITQVDSFSNLNLWIFGSNYAVTNVTVDTPSNQYVNLNADHAGSLSPQIPCQLTSAADINGHFALSAEL